MNKKLLQELNRIHELTYGDIPQLTEIFDFVTTNQSDAKVVEFFKLLKSTADKGGLKKQNRGEGFYQKEVEALQTGLNLLGYNLPKHGIDGIFGTETANAVKKFNQDNNIKGSSPNFLQKFKDLLGLDDSDESDGHDATKETLEKMMDLLKKKNITSVNLSSPNTSNQFSIPADVSSDDEFYKAILNCFGAPSSKENMKFLYAWRQAEGGSAKNNPFNTTWKLKNSTRYGQNKAGVQNYETKQQGIEATCKTLKNNRYSCIVNGLKNDIGAIKISQTCSSALSTWGTHYHKPLITHILISYQKGSSPKPKRIAS